MLRCALPLLLLPWLVTGTGCARFHQPAHSFTFVQMCDPQLGFGGYEADVGRFVQATKQINALHPAFVVVCGDLVNAANHETYSKFKGLKDGLAVKCFCAPGNHDVGNSPTPKSLRFYRTEMGKDYFSFEHQGCSFIILDTQLWKAPMAEESERQEAWFRKTLEKASAEKHPIFLVEHYPFFVTTPDEPDGYYNLPHEKRKELMDLCGRYHVTAILAGHTHKTDSREFQGVQMVTSQTTSRNFDKQPYGFRLWHVTPGEPPTNDFIPLQP